MRLDDAITCFLQQWPSEGPTRDTVETYTYHLKWFAGYAARQSRNRLSDFTPELVRAAMAAKMASAISRAPNFAGGEAAAKGLAAAARKLARWLLAQGVPVADMSVVHAPRVPERIQPRLHEDEFKAIEQSILHRLLEPDARIPRVAIARDLALVYLLADSGLRANEVCSLEVRSIDFDQGAVLVLRSSGKGKKERALSLLDPDPDQPTVTLKLLADWIDVRAEISLARRHQRLFCSMKGNPLTPDSLRDILARICDEAGLEGSRPPHAFRRANFTDMYLGDPSAIRVLASRMGWSDKSHHMVDVYTRGAEIDLARTRPMPSVSARWHGSTITPPERGPILLVGAGSGRGKANGPPPTRREGKVGERTALTNSRRSLHS